MGKELNCADEKDLGLNIVSKYGAYYHNECHYDSLVDALQCGVLGLCGCGTPDSNVKYVRDGLKVIDQLHDVWDKKITYEEWRVIITSFFNNEGAEYFFYYIADVLGLTEHGGSVPGWLTDDGKKFIELADIALSECNNE